MGSYNTGSKVEEEERGDDIQYTSTPHQFKRLEARVLSVSVQFAHYDVGYLFS